MEHVLANWSDLVAHYDRHRGPTRTEFPLADHRAALEEAYSVVKPFAAVIERTEERLTTVPAGPSSIALLVDLATLRLTVAEPRKPLLVYTACKNLGKGPEGGQRGEGAFAGVGAASAIRKISRPAAELSPATGVTRERIKAALDRYFFDPRYNEKCCRIDEAEDSGRGVDYVLEMAACMDPFLSQLSFVNSLASSPAHAATVKCAVWERVVALSVRLAQVADAREQKREQQQLEIRREETSAGDVDRQASPSSRLEEAYETDMGSSGSRKRPRSPTVFEDLNGCDSSTIRVSGVGGRAPPATVGSDVTHAHDSTAGTGINHEFDVSYILESGIFGAVPSTPAKKIETHQGRAESELERFKALGAKRSFGAPPLDGLLAFWASEGCQNFPYLARAARVLLAFPSSSVVSETEKFVGAEGRLRSCSPSELKSSPVVVAAASFCQRGSSSSTSARTQAYAEMVLFLHCNQTLIPENVPELSHQEASGSVPRRLRHPSVLGSRFDLFDGVGAAGVEGVARVVGLVDRSV